MRLDNKQWHLRRGKTVNPCSAKWKSRLPTAWIAIALLCRLDVLAAALGCNAGDGCLVHGKAFEHDVKYDDHSNPFHLEQQIQSFLMRIRRALLPEDRDP